MRAGVHAENDALATELGGGSPRIRSGFWDRSGVDADLVRAGVEHRANILGPSGCRPPTVRGDIDFLGDTADHIQHDGAGRLRRAVMS